VELQYRLLVRERPPVALAAAPVEQPELGVGRDLDLALDHVDGPERLDRGEPQVAAGEDDEQRGLG
jgi:hypothetical protein